MPVDYRLFLDPRFGGQGITSSWVEKARRIRHTDRIDNQFERLVCLWMGFNAWGMCVTLAETDAAMLRMLGKDARASGGFERILADCPTLREAIGSVEHNFPLPSFSDLIRLDPRYDWRGWRNADYWQKIAAAPKGKRVRFKS